MFRHKIVTKRGALAAIAGIVVVSAGMGVSRATGPEPTPTMSEATMMATAMAEATARMVTARMTPMTGAMLTMTSERRREATTRMMKSPTSAPMMGSALTAVEPLAAPMRIEPAAGLEPAPVAMLAPFTWTGASSGQDFWNESANWSGAGVGYPDDSSDDATFNGCGFRAEFDASRTIDDLTVDITGDFCLGYFDANGSEYTLTCDTVTIAGGNDAVYVVEKAGIETN
ncbi:MAG: hypothetical protein KJ057_16715 [Phycisphaerae bacterium]|nr:hypothetical protein [Phycisphaerae bacterium]